MDKKHWEKSKLLQECYYLTRLIQQHNNREKTGTAAVPRQRLNISPITTSKYRKINANKISVNDPQLNISSNSSLANKTFVHKTWINRNASSSKVASSTDLNDSVFKSESSSTQKHCMYFNPNFFKTNISGAEMTNQNLPVSDNTKKNLIHINPKALAQVMHFGLQKENNNFSSEKPLVGVHENSYKKHDSLISNTGKIANRNYGYCSETKLVRSPLRLQDRDARTTSLLQNKKSQYPIKFVNSLSGYNRSLHSWKRKAFNTGHSLNLKASITSPPNSFKSLGKTVRRNSVSANRRISSSSSTSSVVKAAKSVVSKYKITRTVSKKKMTTHSQFSIDRRTDKIVKRLKKVKKYSLKYESSTQETKFRIATSGMHCKKLHILGDYLRQSNSKRPFSSREERNRKLKINRCRELQKTKNGMYSISHLHLVRIGGVLYRSSKLKLAKSVTPKEKNGANKIPQRSQTKSRTNGQRCIVHVRGNAFLMDSRGKKLLRIRKNNNKPTIENKNSAPLKRVDIGGVTFIQKSPNVLIRTNSHKARNLLSQAKQKSIALLMNKMRKSNQPCIFYHRFGKCSKLEKGTCPHIHDPKQIAVCRKFLQGICDLSNCMLSHELGPEKMPTCKYFLEGCCVKDSCPYMHVKVNPKAEICKNFLRGYCTEGQECRKRHINLCPDFENGRCSNGKYCPYPHQTVVKSKSRIKKKAFTNKNLSTKLKIQQKRYYQEERQKDPLKLEDKSLETKVEDLEEHKSELEIKRIKILQKVDLMKRAWQNAPSNSSDENIGNRDPELLSEGFSGETGLERPKLGSLPAFIPIG